jgi:hypothetical protein
MNSKNMAGIFGWTAVLFLIFFAVAALFLTQTDFVDGKVIDAGYVAKDGSVSSFKEDNGLHGTTTAIENFYLVIEVDGNTSSYPVEYGTFVKAMTGQAVFKMWCTPFSCTLME